MLSFFIWIMDGNVDVGFQRKKGIWMRNHLRSSLGWIPGLKIKINFLYGRFFLLKKLEMIPLIKLVLGISKFWSNSLGIWFWKFRSDFEIAWVAAICVGVLFSKSLNVFIFLRWSNQDINRCTFEFLIAFSFKSVLSAEPKFWVFNLRMDDNSTNNQPSGIFLIGRVLKRIGPI